MKREILFRGKSIDTGEWVYGFYWALLDPCSEKTLFKKHFIHSGCNIANPCEVFFDSVGQFTGLIDKNGKKVFEGDILAASCDDKTTLFTCYWSEENTAFYLSNKFNPAWGRLSRLFEIASEDNWLIFLVGNLIDNPDMAAKHD